MVVGEFVLVVHGVGMLGDIPGCVILVFFTQVGGQCLVLQQVVVLVIGAFELVLRGAAPGSQEAIGYDFPAAAIAGLFPVAVAEGIGAAYQFAPAVVLVGPGVAGGVCLVDRVAVVVIVVLDQGQPVVLLLVVDGIQYHLSVGIVIGLVLVVFLFLSTALVFVYGGTFDQGGHEILVDRIEQGRGGAGLIAVFHFQLDSY